MDDGALAGIIKPYHSRTLTGTPCSRNVAVSGAKRLRLSPEAAKMRNLPALAWGRKSPIGPQNAEICEPSRSCTPGTEPRYGMCFRPTLLCFSSMMPMMCGIEPAPGLPKLALSGLARVQSRNPFKFLTDSGTPGPMASAWLIQAPLETGVTSSSLYCSLGYVNG